MFTLALVLFSAGAFAFQPSDDHPMLWEEYVAALSSANAREADAKKSIGTEQAAIDSIQKNISVVVAKLGSTIQQTYEILGITAADVDNAMLELTFLKTRIGLLQSYMPSQLSDHAKEVDQLTERSTALQAKKVSWLFAVARECNDVATAINHLKEILASYTAPKVETPAPAPKPIPVKVPQTSTYTVTAKTRTLSAIAAEVYNDPNSWPLLYRANKALFDKAYAGFKKNGDTAIIEHAHDLLIPGWILEVPR